PSSPTRPRNDIYPGPEDPRSYARSATEPPPSPASPRAPPRLRTRAKKPRKKSRTSFLNLRCVEAAQAALEILNHGEIAGLSFERKQILDRAPIQWATTESFAARIDLFEVGQMDPSLRRRLKRGEKGLML